jgi:hypothetical protein
MRQACPRLGAGHVGTPHEGHPRRSAMAGRRPNPRRDRGRPIPRHLLLRRVNCLFSELKSLIRLEQGIGCRALELRQESTAGGMKMASKGEKFENFPDHFPVGRESGGTTIDWAASVAAVT